MLDKLDKTNLELELLLNWNTDDSSWGSNDWVVSNWSWVDSERWFQKEALLRWASTTLTYSSTTYTNSYIRIKSSWTWSFEHNHSSVSTTALSWIDWNTYAMLRLYNITLTDIEEQALYLEWLRRLWQKNYPKLFEGCVALFECDEWWQDLYNHIDWTDTTRTWWTNTTDNFNITKWITNPNYSRTSITYTNSYLWEDSGWWTLTKNDSNVTATWINKTTTFGRLFLFNRTLSADEETQLEALCNKDYILPRTKTSTNNLQDWLELAIDWTYSGTTFYDQSGNWNNGTGSNMIDWGRIWQHKIMEFNGTSSYIDTNTSINWNSDFSYSFWIKPVDYADHSQYIFRTWKDDNNFTWIRFDLTGDITSYRKVGWTHHTTAFPWWFSNDKWCFYTFVYDYSESKFYTYVDTKLIDTKTNATQWLWIQTENRIWQSFWLGYFDWQITDTRVINRALSPVEIQQLYYRTFIPNT